MKKIICFIVFITTISCWIGLPCDLDGCDNGKHKYYEDSRTVIETIPVTIDSMEFCFVVWRIRGSQEYCNRSFTHQYGMGFENSFTNKLNTEERFDTTIAECK